MLTQLCKERAPAPSYASSSYVPTEIQFVCTMLPNTDFYLLKITTNPLSTRSSNFSQSLSSSTYWPLLPSGIEFSQIFSWMTESSLLPGPIYLPFCPLNSFGFTKGWVFKASSWKPLPLLAPQAPSLSDHIYTCRFHAVFSKLWFCISAGRSYIPLAFYSQHAPVQTLHPKLFCKLHFPIS